MTKLQEKAQAQVKQMVGQMTGDDRLTQEGREQQQKANQENERLENRGRPETISSQQQQRDPERRKGRMSD